VADLDDLLDAEWLAALDARLAGGDGVEVGEPAVEVTAGADAAQVETLAVRADDVDAALEMLVGEHRHPGADRADRPCRRAQVLADLVGVRRADLFAEGAGELPFVERVVAADQHEHGPGALPDIEKRLEREARIDRQEPRDLGDRAHAGPRTRLVALLGLDLVPDLRQVAVGADLARGEPRDDFLVRHPEAQVASVAVPQLEHLRDALPAARLLPDVGRMDHGHRDLLP